MLSQFLTELDGIEDLKGVLVLGATNRLDRLDLSVLRPGRFDEILEIPPLEESDRREILGVHLRGKPIATQVDVGELAARTEGYGGAEIASLCRRAGLSAVRRAVVSREAHKPSPAVAIRLEPEDFEAAFMERPA
jgi:transitional endoplasmic reticulum ATPase